MGNAASGLAWKDLLHGDGHLNAAQRQAFERAIEQVNQCLHATLGGVSTPCAGRFSLGHHVDNLERSFLRDAGTDQVRGAAALTAYWIVRLLVERIQQASTSR